MDEGKKESIVRSRLKKPMDDLALIFSSSIKDDEKIFYYDILVDLAHVISLHKSNYLNLDEAKEIIKALLRIRDEGYENIPTGYEDVHEAIEAKLTGITPHGKKMHTGRSRNDEVATCLRLYARDKLLSIMESLLNLRNGMIKLAEENIDVISPGFTHLQYAQPTRLSHHFLAYCDMFKRDFDRAFSAFKRVNLSPLGSSAFASTSFNINREFTSKLLGFNGLVENSMDAVSSRDFAIESIFVASSILLSLSRIAEELILWSSEFNFIELPDEFSSSSSIMPQKKNPDIAELIRARTGRVCGDLMSAMMIYKAMPFTYNRDFQEINPLLYFSLESAEITTNIMSSMLLKLKIKKDVLREKAIKGFTIATDLADILVQKTGIPFRIAHKIVGLIAMEYDKILSENFEKSKIKPSSEFILKSLLDSAERVCKDTKYLEKIKELDEKDIEVVINPEMALERKKNIGSPSKTEVLKMLNSRKDAIQKDFELVENEIESISSSLEILYSKIEKILKEEVA